MSYYYSEDARSYSSDYTRYSDADRDGYDYRGTYGGSGQAGDQRRRAGYRDERNGQRGAGYRGESNGQRRGRRGGGNGGGRDYRCAGNRKGGRRRESGPGVGTVTGSGYEGIDRALTDRHLRDVWAGRSGAREVNAEDPRLQQEFLICRRPGFSRTDRSVRLDVNYFTVWLDAAPRELFKYHLDVERSPDVAAESTYGPATEPRPLPRTLVGDVINAALRQYEAEFGDIRLVHDGMAAL